MASSQRNHEAFMQQQESSYRTHQAQMAQSASSFHSAMNNANNAMNARSTASSDWVDYALDQQTVTGQGGTVKVSSSYSQTWSSTVGNQTTWYQTNDPNTNPNGVLPGNWTQDTKVHGNGQPY
jgi:1,2-phenylacetyl-CoA epoxidase PaaB subunit